MTTSRAQLDGKRHWQVMSGLIVVAVAYLVWDTTKNPPQKQLLAAQHEFGLIEMLPIVVIMAVIASYLVSLPKTITPEEENEQ